MRRLVEFDVVVVVEREVAARSASGAAESSFSRGGSCVKGEVLIHGTS